MSEAAMTCGKCKRENCPVLINGRCADCKPFRVCPRPGCGGTLESAPKPNWMNRWKCDTCRKSVSR